nr:MAG TPA: hypothetical protein [Bacteriophage sp.]
MGFGLKLLYRAGLLPTIDKNSIFSTKSYRYISEFVVFFVEKFKETNVFFKLSIHYLK